MLTHVPGGQIPAADYLLRLEVGPEDRILLKLADSIPMFQIENDNASKTAKQKEGESDYYPHDEVDEKHQKHRLNTWDDKTSGQNEQEHPTATEIDVHQLTARRDTGYRKTSLKDQVTFVRLANIGPLPPRAMDSVSSSITIKLQVVQENNRDIQQVKPYF